MDDEREINWLAIFLKIIIIFLISIIIIWFISKIFMGKKKNNNFDYNLEEMSDYSYEYFKGIELPKENDKYIIISLDDMLNHDFFSFKNKKELKKCNVDDSYSKITKTIDNYKIETRLICGKSKGDLDKTLLFDDYINVPDYNEEHEENDGKVKYYEYTKEEISYGPWLKGNLKSNNIENRYEYYATENYIYYSIGYIPKNESEFSYVLKLNKVPNKNYHFVSEESSTYINIKEISKYTKEKNISLKEKNLKLPKNIKEYIIPENNFIYDIYPYYKDNNFYVRVNIKLRDNNNIKSYYDKNLKEDVYLVPIKINLKFSSSNATTSKPNGKYDTISYYRLINKKVDTIWSKEDYVNGYKKTGKTEMR